MVYTKEQIDLFDKMFTIKTEYTCYSHHNLTEEGHIEGPKGEGYYNTGEATITLSDGQEYVIQFGESDDAEEHARNAFSEFIRLNYDEVKFKEYLDNESSFHPA